MKNLRALPMNDAIINGINCMDIYPAVIVKALNGKGVNPANIIIINPC